MDHEEGSELDRDLVGGVPTDEAIEVEIKDALFWNGIDMQQVAVSVRSGAVTLYGEVPTQEQKDRAEQIARHVHGVTDISNDLRVAAGQRR